MLDREAVDSTVADAENLPPRGILPTAPP